MLVILILIIKTVGASASLFLNELARRIALPTAVILLARVLMHKITVEVLVALLVMELLLKEPAVPLCRLHTFNDFGRKT